MNNGIKLLLLVLLVKPISGLGQQQPASKLESLVAEARQAQAAHDFVAAQNDYKQALRIEPNMQELWANLGLIQRQAGDQSTAILSFQHANRLNPSLYVPNLFLGINLLHEGKATEAIPLLSKAEKANKIDPQAPLALGRAYISAGKFSAAVEELNRAITIDPKLGSAWFTLGIARLDQVESDARKMSMEGKESPFAGALYAESLQKQGRFREASTLYKTLIAAQPQPPCIQSEMGFSLLRGHDEPGAAAAFAAERVAHPQCGMALLGQARMALDNGDNEQAAKLLGELWGRDHGFVESNAAILLEGMSSEKASSVAGLLTAAESTPLPPDLRSALLASFNTSIQDAGDHIPEEDSAEPARRTAQEYYTAGNFQMCARHLDRTQPTKNADELRLLAACAFYAGDNQRASSAATALQALQPHSLEALYWSIQANERLAFKSLAQFQQLAPDSVESHVLLGDIYSQLERFDDAQAEFGKALAIAPNDPAAMLGLASAYFDNNNMEKAMEIARSALARSPNDPELNLIMAEAMLSRHELDEVEPYLEKSLHGKPQMLPHVHALIGRVYAETGRTQAAIDQLKLGASSDKDGSIQYLLARLYRKLGDTKDASQALDRMKAIKQQRQERGYKAVEDPDLSALESGPK